MRAGTLIVAILAPVLCAAGGAGTFRAGTSLVLVNVSVLDPKDRPVIDLSQTQFRILDNGREQPIRFFAHEDAPVSLAVILDASGSMTAKWSRARNMLASFCENLAPGDELFLVTVEQRPRLMTDYTSDCAEMQNRLLLTRPHGATALLDAIPLAVAHLSHARHARHAILIISDGGENASRTRLATIRSMAQEANAQIYSATLGLEAGFARSAWPGEADGPELLGEIAEFTGGRAFAIDDRRRIADAAASMAREIHDQYVIGYQPPAATDDGKYHRISVKVQRDPSQPRLSLFHRNGYRIVQ
ncbi:MAG: VWA domain-containing protein [Candidatus Solibacter sp.]|nr:VWA domain-containing protein [Candidatus Solibacter sp.]